MNEHVLGMLIMIMMKQQHWRTSFMDLLPFLMPSCSCSERFSVGESILVQSIRRRLGFRK